MPAKGRGINRLSYAEEHILRCRVREAEANFAALRGRLDQAEAISAALLAQLIAALEAKATAERRADNLDSRLHDMMHGRGGKVYRMEQGKLAGRTA